MSSVGSVVFKLSNPEKYKIKFIAKDAIGLKFSLIKIVASKPIRPRKSTSFHIH